MNHKRYMHPTIKLGKICEGTGVDYKYPENDVLRQYPEAIECGTCEGSGRVLVSKITVITVSPFKNK